MKLLVLSQESLFANVSIVHHVLSIKPKEEANWGPIFLFYVNTH